MPSNIILQHFDGELRELDKLSIANIQQYASMIGADYELILGKPFNESLTAPCQKIHMLSKKFDVFDQVLMLDIDMFYRNGLKKNVFEEKGNGIHDPTQHRLHASIAKKYPNCASIKTPYWGGAIYKFNKDERIRLREHIPQVLQYCVSNYNKPYHFEDEGIMHSLAYFAQFPVTKNSYMSQKWCKASFNDPNDSFLIHIRTKIGPNGPKRDKLTNYKSLKKQGIID